MCIQNNGPQQTHDDNVFETSNTHMDARPERKEEKNTAMLQHHYYYITAWQRLVCIGKGSRHN